MIPLPDLETYSTLEWTQYNWLLAEGAPADVLARLSPIRVARGVQAGDGLFEENAAGQSFLAFPEAEDIVFWQPRTGEMASFNGRAFALGEDAIGNPATYSFDCRLNILPDPLEWLRWRQDGIVVLDWTRAWSRLQDAPRIAVHERAIFQYRRHMQPPRAPDTVVLVDRRAAA